MLQTLFRHLRKATARDKHTGNLKYQSVADCGTPMCRVFSSGHYFLYFRHYQRAERLLKS